MNDPSKKDLQSLPQGERSRRWVQGVLQGDAPRSSSRGLSWADQQGSSSEEEPTPTTRPFDPGPILRREPIKDLMAQNNSPATA
jgi:hypothetical protein